MLVRMDVFGNGQYLKIIEKEQKNILARSLEKV